MPAFPRPAHLIRFTVLLLLWFAPASARAAGVHGLVLGPDGQPLAGAHVVVSNPIGVAGAAETGDDGEFRVDQLDASPYELRAVLDGFLADPLPLRLAADEDRPVTIRMRLSAWSESIVVSTAQVDAPRSRTADSVTAFTGAELRARQVESVADALRLVPAFGVAGSGGRGGLVSALPRGGESDFTLVLIDGIRANAFGGGFDFSKLPAAGLERVEIVRGPQSALYGSDAIGGVVQLVTLRDGPASLSASLESGSFATVRTSVTGSGSRGPWSWSGGAERLASDGFRGIAPATGERVTNDDYTLGTGSGSIGWRGGRRVEARGTARALSTDRGYPGPFGSNPIGACAGVDRISRGSSRDGQFGMSLSSPWPRIDWRVRQRIQVSGADLADHFTSPWGDSDTRTGRLDVRTQTDVILGDRTSASLGFEQVRERARNTYIAGLAGQQVPVTRGIAGLFGEIRRAGERLSASAGFRLDRIRRGALEPDPNAFSPRPALAASTILSANPKAALTWQARSPDARGPVGWTRLHATAGTGIRPPDALEVAFTDNPDLRPERSRSLEAGVAQALAGETISVELTGFANRFDDLIVAVGPSMRNASRFVTDNIANARTRGVELGLETRLRSGLDVRLAYTLLDSAVLALDRLPAQAPSPFAVGQPLVRRARHRGSLDVVLSRPRLTAFAAIGARGRMLDVEPSFGASAGLFSAAGYFVASGGLTYRIGRVVEIYGRVGNIFDRSYEEVYGFPAMGRNGMLGVRIAARK